MEFRISRASNWGFFNDGKKPLRDKRLYSKMIKKYKNDDKEIIKAWFININTLEELMELRKQVKEDLIIGRSYEDEDIVEILIYDDYIE